MKELGNILRTLREEKKLSREDLAKIAGKSRRGIEDMEKRGTPNIKTLVEICNGLGVSVISVLKQAGIDGEEVSVESAIKLDPVLTSNEKDILINLYTTLKKHH